MSQLKPKVMPMLHIVVAEKYPEHSGYCSDAGEDLAKEEIKTYIYKLNSKELKFLLEKEIIDDYGDGDIYNARQHNFTKVTDFDKGESICHQGSGVCGYEGYSYVKLFKVKIPLNFSKFL